MEPLRLGMLGMWHSHAGGIVTRVADHPQEFDLVGFYDADPKVIEKRRSEWAPTLPYFKVFRTPEELLDQKLDGVVVEGHIHENLPYARQALKAGKHVMLEKPAGKDLGEYQSLIDLAQRKHLLVQMIYLFRYKPNVVEMIAQRKQGALGDPYMFKARMPKPLGSYDRYKTLFSHFAGGIFFEMACHVIDMMATCLELAGTKYPQQFAGNTLTPHESFSLVPIFEGQAVDRQHAYIFNHAGTHAIVKGDYKIVREGKGPWALYNLANNRTETKNLAEQYPERVATLAKIWEARWGKGKK